MQPSHGFHNKEKRNFFHLLILSRAVEPIVGKLWLLTLSCASCALMQCFKGHSRDHVQLHAFKHSNAALSARLSPWCQCLLSSLVILGWDINVMLNVWTVYQWLQQTHLSNVQEIDLQKEAEGTSSDLVRCSANGIAKFVAYGQPVPVLPLEK